MDFDSLPDDNATATVPPSAGVPPPGKAPASFDSLVDDEEKYSQPGEELKGVVEGVGRGLAGPLFTGAETALLGNEKEQLLRRENQPYLQGAAEAAGFVGPAVLSGGASMAAKAGLGGAELASRAAKLAELSQAGILEKAGSKVAGALNLGGNEAKLLSKIGAKSVSEATQMALLQGGDEISKMIQKDPDQTASTVVADIGLAGLLGGGVGAAFGTVSPLWKATVGDKAAQLVEDFKGRMKFNLDNPELPSAVAEELGSLYHGTRSVVDEVYGPAGLKAQDIEKAMPEMHPGIPEQSQQIANDLENRIVKMQEKPNSYPDRLVSKAQADFDAYRAAIQDPHATPSSIFDATQDLKQTFQGYSKYDKFVKPVDEAYDFVSEAKELARSLRERLEDTDVWGKAAERQKALNSAFSEYLPALKDFEKKFTTEVSGERIIDPGKVNTYVNQMGKPNAEIRQSMLENFIREAESYKKVVAATHANLGIENPIPVTSLQATKGTLGKLTPGAKLADYFAKRGITELAGETMASGVGGAIGHTVGHGGIGALIGEKALGPFFKSVLPGIVDALRSSPATSAGVKAAIDYGLAAARGETVINKAVKGVFQETGGKVLEIKPNESDRLKLQKSLKAAQTNPMSLQKVAGDIGTMLPQHATSLAATSARAVQYLNSIRPNTDPQRPLDPKMPPNPVQEAKYNRALDVANQPLLALESIKRGTLTPDDVITVATCYPALYQKLSQKIVNEIINRTDKSSPIPYQQRLQAAMFTGQALDSTMTPIGILSAQPKPQPAPNSPGDIPGKPPSYNSTKGLGKLAQNAQTPGQTREASKSMNKG